VHRTGRRRGAGQALRLSWHSRRPWSVSSAGARTRPWSLMGCGGVGGQRYEFMGAFNLTCTIPALGLYYATIATPGVPDASVEVRGAAGGGTAVLHTVAMTDGVALPAGHADVCEPGEPAPDRRSGAHAANAGDVYGALHVARPFAAAVPVAVLVCPSEACPCVCEATLTPTRTHTHTHGVPPCHTQADVHLDPCAVPGRCVHARRVASWSRARG
jgi:hypothetical protein